MKNLILEVKVKKLISCYENKGLPLHQKCPYGKKELNTSCQLCCRRTEKVMEVQTQNESHYSLKGWKKFLFKIIFRR